MSSFFSKKYIWVLLFCLSLVGCFPSAVEPERSALPLPNFDGADGAGAVSSESFSRANQELLSSINDELSKLKREIRELRNTVEELQFDNEVGTRRQKDLFQDLDRRMLVLERASQAISSQPVQSENSQTAADTNNTNEIFQSSSIDTNFIEPVAIIGVDNRSGGLLAGEIETASNLNDNDDSGLSALPRQASLVQDEIAVNIVETPDVSSDALGLEPDELLLPNASLSGEKNVTISVAVDQEKPLLENAEQELVQQVDQQQISEQQANQQQASAVNDDVDENLSIVTVQQQEAYDLAFELLKQSRYDESIKQFQQFVDRWSNSPLADDAYYWLSEANYVNRAYEDALSGFNAIVVNYPDSDRVPDALLKVGYIRYDIGDYDSAAEIFRDILNRFPEHQVTVSAQTRLQRIEQTIQ